MRGEAVIHTLGNGELLKLHKVAFLCSRNCPADVRARSCQWAKRQCDNGVCVISGFHSAIEREVLDHLLEGTQPIIVALAKGISNRLEAKLLQGVDAGRLLIVTRYAESVTHACEDSCFHRNRLMMEMADETVVAYAAPGGKLERLCRENAGLKVSML